MLPVSIGVGDTDNRGRPAGDAASAKRQVAGHESLEAQITRTTGEEI